MKARHSHSLRSRQVQAHEFLLGSPFPYEQSVANVISDEVAESGVANTLTQAVPMAADAKVAAPFSHRELCASPQSRSRTIWLTLADSFQGR